MEVIVGNYTALPLTIIGYIPSQTETRKKKNGDEVPKMIYNRRHYLYMRDNRSRMTWRFVGVTRQNKTLFSDGRHQVLDLQTKDPRFDAASLRTQLARLVGDEAAGRIIATMFATEVKASDVEDILAPWKTAIETAAAQVAATRLATKKVNYF